MDRARYLLTMWLLAMHCLLRAQADSVVVNALKCVIAPTDTVFTIVEQKPRFPGGEAELFRYLGKAIKYPGRSGDDALPSTVHLSFVIRQDGSICGVEASSVWSHEFVEQLRAMVYAMPSWEPGMQRGKPVNVRYNLPIRIHWK